MDDRKKQLVQFWFTKAQRDLSEAKELSDERNDFDEKKDSFDIPLYHCQQSAEKAVKGFLVLHDINPPKTHDIEISIRMAVKIRPDFIEYKDAAVTLTQYTTESRYPAENMNTSEEELKAALKNASEILDFSISALPSDLQTCIRKQFEFLV